LEITRQITAPARHLFLGLADLVLQFRDFGGQLAERYDDSFRALIQRCHGLVLQNSAKAGSAWPHPAWSGSAGMIAA
jgi:hypothetical protein